jgi:hypothetical protein
MIGSHLKKERRCKPKMKKFTLKISIPENLRDFNSAEEWGLSESLFI